LNRVSSLGRAKRRIQTEAVVHGKEVESTNEDAPLFPTLRHGRLNGRTPLPQLYVHVMLQTRALAAGIRTRISAIAFARQGSQPIYKMAASWKWRSKWPGMKARTTGLYDRRNEDVALDEVERIAY
jgi:integrase/recombinase XerD